MLSPELLLHAYTTGSFPMGMEDGEIAWFSPDPRGILPLHEFHIPHGLRRVLKKNPFTISMDTDFSAVVRGCAHRRDTWITAQIIESYSQLYTLGYAHSVEAWVGEELMGGLYGVAIGGAFFGESMFSRQSEASKIALVFLVERLQEGRFTLLDIQWVNAHLLQFGAQEIPREEYLQRLEEAIALKVSF